MFDSLKSQIATLYSLSHELLYLGQDDTPIYSDHFTHLNKEVFRLANALYDNHSSIPEEEASLCLSLLMGYNATLYNNGDKQERIQHILYRCWEVLQQLPASLQKAQLLTYCYGEVYDEELAREAHTIIDGWSARELTAEEHEVIKLLKDMEENPYPWSEIEETV
ncbi:UpxZ family transcription anti-terminator antagonist [Bacteroides sp.]